MLRRAARDLPSSFPAWTAAHVESHLAGISGAGPRTRNNVLGILRQLARFGQRRGHLAREWSGLDAVDRELVPPPPPALYSPDELRRLLAVTGPRLRPVIVLTALCGVRTAEACRLDWPDVTDRGVIVQAAKAKTRSRRIAPVGDAAGAWLAKDRPEDGGRRTEGGRRRAQSGP